MKKIHFLLFLLSLFQTALAQSRLSVSAPDSMAFILLINEEKINNVLCSAITLERIPSGKATIKMICRKDQPVEVTQPVNLKDLTHTSFELRKIKNELKLVTVSEISASFFIPPVASENPDTLPHVAAPLPGYTGATGCDILVETSEFDRLKSELASYPFESRKLGRMKSFSSDHCLLVDQLYFLLTQLELEENKVTLLEAAKGHIYDLDHLDKINSIFFLEKNRQKVREIIAH